MTTDDVSSAPAGTTPGDDDAGQTPLPTFLVIGAHRAATRWVRTNLAEHPDIYVAPKPIGFFTDPDWVGGFRGYRNRFRPGRGYPVVGEVDPQHLNSRHDLLHLSKAIDDRLPDVRLIAVVRNPVDRMYSAFRDHVIHGRLPSDANLMAMIRSGDASVAKLDLIGGSRYAENLYPYWRRFGDRLRIIVLDDIADDPAKAYHEILDHVGARTDFVASRLDRVLYSNAHSRWTKRSIPTDEERRAYAMLFRTDVEELEAMLGRFLPAWDPGPPPANWQEMIGATASEAW